MRIYAAPTPRTCTFYAAANAKSLNHTLHFTDSATLRSQDIPARLRLTPSKAALSAACVVRVAENSQRRVISSIACGRLESGGNAGILSRSQPTAHSAMNASDGWAMRPRSGGPGSYNFDIAAFTEKWLEDIRDAQMDNGAFTQTFTRYSVRAGTEWCAWLGRCGCDCSLHHMVAVRRRQSH